MKRIKASLAIATLAATTGSAVADDITGLWLRPDGTAKVKFETCDDSLCGVIVWLKPGAETKAQIGQRVFFDVKADGAGAWTGKAVSVDGSKTFSGQMAVSGPSLTISGCLIGGFICKSTVWTRTP
jgi:uncharacterized protein (DUF2147 family)